MVVLLQSTKLPELIEKANEYSRQGYGIAQAYSLHSQTIGQSTTHYLWMEKRYAPYAAAVPDATGFPSGPE